VFGVKDVCNLWKAEKFEPEKLIALYQRAGAKYFVAMANHHCNFDAWDSKYQPWNTMNVGPKRDIIGAWGKAARAAGLPFGVTVHSGRSWDWYQVAHEADKEGPKQGVPYDGILTQADGKGKWWEGLDPAELYGPHGPARTGAAKKAYDDKFLNRVLDLITKYRPELLYFDDGVLPLRHSGEEYGLKIAAHLYNTSAKAHGGKNQAVMNTKNLNDPKHRQCLVWDIERGKSDKIEPFPWQTDTCIGSWHYQRGIYDRKTYKNSPTIVYMLIDIVSKNGNLLLNIPLRGDGTPDDEEVKILEGVAKWTAVNQECIFGTRPFTVYGEGPSTADQEKGSHGGLRDAPRKPYSGRDIRFTTKGATLYAILMAWPEDGKLTIQTLAKGSKHYQGEIAEVRLLGSDAPLKWERTDSGLVVALPASKPCDYAYALKIVPGSP
jgi:alpha-L-fucosidase